METIETKKADYYLSSEEIETLEDALGVIGKLMLTNGDRIKDYRYHGDGSNKTLTGGDIEACFWALNYLNIMLENTNHIYRINSLKNYDY